ncbi:hypothetical protein ASD48_38340 [Streptomyces sp. Root1310]|nr:hypothetical protein ASD48_38340 [Streptomyces sp. Root1310]
MESRPLPHNLARKIIQLRPGGKLKTTPRTREQEPSRTRESSFLAPFQSAASLHDLHNLPRQR